MYKLPVGGTSYFICISEASVDPLPVTVHAVVYFQPTLSVKHTHKQSLSLRLLVLLKRSNFLLVRPSWLWWRQQAKTCCSNSKIVLFTAVLQWRCGLLHPWRHALGTLESAESSSSLIFCEHRWCHVEALFNEQALNDTSCHILRHVIAAECLYSVCVHSCWMGWMCCRETPSRLWSRNSLLTASSALTETWPLRILPGWEWLDGGASNPSLPVHHWIDLCSAVR